MVKLIIIQYDNNQFSTTCAYINSLRKSIQNISLYSEHNYFPYNNQLRLNKHFSVNINQCSPIHTLLLLISRPLKHSDIEIENVTQWQNTCLVSKYKALSLISLCTDIVMQRTVNRYKHLLYKSEDHVQTSSTHIKAEYGHIQICDPRTVGDRDRRISQTCSNQPSQIW